MRSTIKAVLGHDDKTEIHVKHIPSDDMKDDAIERFISNTLANGNILVVQHLVPEIHDDPSVGKAIAIRPIINDNDALWLKANYRNRQLGETDLWTKEELAHWLEGWLYGFCSAAAVEGVLLGFTDTDIWLQIGAIASKQLRVDYALQLGAFDLTDAMRDLYYDIIANYEKSEHEANPKKLNIKKASVNLKK